MESITGIEDIDREILLKLDDENLYNACSTNRYAEKLCNPYFWYLKFVQTFGVDLDKYGRIDYKQLYRKLRQMNKEKILKFASLRGYLELVKEMVESGADVHSYNDRAVVDAAGQGHLEIVKYLVQHGANINVRNKSLLGPAMNNHLDVVKFIIKHNGRFLENEESNQLLSIAAVNGNMDFVKYTIEELDATNIDRALTAAPMSKNEEDGLAITKYLLDVGADIHYDNDLALTQAIRNEKFKIVKYLIENGANINALQTLTPYGKKFLEGFLKNQTTKSQCVANTKAGTRCKNIAKQGFKYCGIHNKLFPE